MFTYLAAPKFSASSPKGRLLTPEEGCGYSKVQSTRIVGGSPAKIGEWKISGNLFNLFTAKNYFAFLNE